MTSVPLGLTTIGPELVLVHPEVEQARRRGGAIVALESTISSSLGLPPPYNREVVDRCCAAIRSNGATPAITAVVDGRIVVGVDNEALPRVLASTSKCAARDIAIALAAKTVGVTTVSATLAICAAAGISVFATGGIGGVHRDDHVSGDVSADIHAIARSRVITVTAGAKAFLDLAKTVELFDTLSVPVLGMCTDEFPAFYSRRSGIRIHHRIESCQQAAAIAATHWRLNGGGVIVANPIPHEAEISREEIDPAIARALAEAKAEGICGAALTPFVLGKIAVVTEGRSIPANLALAEHNASIAATIARELVR